MKRAAMAVAVLVTILAAAGCDSGGSKNERRVGHDDVLRGQPRQHQLLGRLHRTPSSA